ncbi:MAG: hypothetical protein IPP34_16330 [Bacteroidetes bacterium]|nr:hypothetical protein [Bacteroidota bacterium]
MENEKAFTENDSLAIISKMIKTAQQNFGDGSFYYIFWGGWFHCGSSKLRFTDDKL